MKALLVIAHFFRPDDEGRYSSTKASMRAQRREALESVLLSWRGHCQPTATIDVGTRTFRKAPGVLEQLDIIVMVHGDNHLFDAALRNRFRVQTAHAKVADPRWLPFGAHMILASGLGQYDWLVYSEDDLVLHDPFFFPKLAAFQERHGPGRVLQPNRYELNLKDGWYKTYIDGDLREETVARLHGYVEEKEPVLAMDSAGGAVMLERARNPHSGFFALTSAQMAHWQACKHFMDADTSFVSPLESAATLGIVKTFAVFKARAPHQGFLEVQHLDRKFSNNPFPVAE